MADFDPKKIFDTLDYIIIKLVLLVLLVIGAWALISHAIKTIP